MTINKMPLTVAVVLCLAMAISSCSPRFALTGASKKEYRMDASLPDDRGVAQEYLPYKRQLDSAMNIVVGTSDQHLTKPYDSAETLLGDFFCEALMQQARQLGAAPDICLATKGGLRADLPRGPITVGKVYELMPFENELVTVTLKAPEVRKLLDFIAASGGQPEAGIRMTIRAKKAVDASIGGRPFNENRPYILLTYDYLATGAEHLDFLRGLPQQHLHKKVRDALLDHIRQQTAANKNINIQTDGRVTVDTR
ncbi:MAG TPA: 5'-nucleotidase [Puia sp.]|uniref:5'-nucleotidase n=1 Tax=Puia sp. TaxID=2045100 RepID=UPI002BD57EB7|nr:5'-nucleotidase [Puia sp.]HVU94687.1 5'-nucleotidase [Puia sp.]